MLRYIAYATDQLHSNWSLWDGEYVPFNDTSSHCMTVETAKHVFFMYNKICYMLFDSVIFGANRSLSALQVQGKVISTYQCHSSISKAHIHRAAKMIRFQSGTAIWCGQWHEHICLHRVHILSKCFNPPAGSTCTFARKQWTSITE